ncbi:MAG: FAD:protein FMN transferase [Hydrogenovibrio sp.]|uniref:FAD:protein FMN transferase n=1 Tax=Hydrogenovibrio sp. TaxID=2065821 RepID=UPI002870586C|nr:FAD:protein FMN transferase [Hydrogenovibrio sp.]MDR9498006.1 FAD:protein FMN transferase [Hydrogenovibrio sp.]
MRPKLLFFLIALTGSLLFACQAPTQTHQTRFPVFGTVVSLTANETDRQTAQSVFSQIEQRFHAMHKDWHAWNQSGQLHRINQAIARGEPIEVPPLFKRFILKTQALSKASDALFDPAIGSLIALWGFHSEHWEGPPPSKAERQAWLKTRPRITDLWFEGLTLHSRNPAVQLDFGGNAKGLALDLAAERFKAAGIDNAVINIGGDLRILGQRDPQTYQAWSIGVQDPADPTQALASITVEGDESLVTSGTYQRAYQWQGQTFSHILNPNTAAPTDYFASVTVAHPDATTADSAATALMVAGPSQWQRIADRMGIKQAFVVAPDGRCFATPAMAERLHMVQCDLQPPNSESNASLNRNTTLPPNSTPSPPKSTPESV